MFSIAAINDTDSKAQWEPLAPTKEAQEFHISQTYHEGLLKLHVKEYEKARELLESVLRDPLISSAQVDNSASDSHILQLRFLALKNLATTFLQMGSSYQENALKCYLEAVEIDGKDTVVWNQLGTLSCSMGSLSISRWAFEQGLLCSPSNWNCMEKLLEVLIAIGDEVACLTVAKMILRHWPSHSRAFHVKSTIDETDIAPFAPRGIDRLEPKHVRLKFLDKRKATDEISSGDAPLKRLKQNMELLLPEASWLALVDALLDVLTPLSEEKAEKELRSGDVQLEIKLPCSESMPLEDRGINACPVGEEVSQGDYNSERENTSKDKAAATSVDQPQERRITRLGRLRSRKPDKEEAGFASSKDSAAVIKFLELFITSRTEDEDSKGVISGTAIRLEQACSFGTESNLLEKFANENSKNYGAYHVAHLLLEEAAKRNFTCPNVYIKLLELEKLTRYWGQDRTLECNLFLSELCYDSALTCPEASKRSDFLSDASYHLCKVIESVSLDYGASSAWGSINFTADAVNQHPVMGTSLLKDRSPFWIRFFWLSGRLSGLDDNNKAKAEKEFSISLSLFSEKESTNDSFLIHMPHCKTVKELTVDRVLYDINKLKVGIVMEKAVEMIEKQMYVECINSLAPLLFCTKDVYPDILPLSAKGDEISLIELSALDLLIKASEKTEPVDFDVCYNCHQRKLQILMAISGLEGFPFSHNSLQQLGSSAPGLELRNSSMQWNWVVAQEVKAISQCVSKVKTDQSGDSTGNAFPASSVGGVQSLLLAVMCNIASMLSSRKSTESEPVDDINETKQRSCFINAAIAFCKFQHLNPSVPIKTQVALIMAIHDLLAEYGICCAGEGNEGEEGAFLKFAIKHLLALDMKLKSSSNSSNEDVVAQLTQQLSKDILPDPNSGAHVIDIETTASAAHEMFALENDLSGDVSENCISSQKVKEKNHMKIDGCDVKVVGDDNNKPVECESDLTEDEKEELEMKIDNALDQCFFCLYGLNLRADSAYEDELANHKNTSRGEYQTKEQCADVFQYILPYARGSSKTGLGKLRRVLRTIRKQFHQPPEEVLAVNVIDKFLDNMELCEDKLSKEAGSDGFLQTMINILFASSGSLKQYKKLLRGSSDPYMDVYGNLYFFLAQSEEMSATDKWTGFVLAKEGEDFVQQNATLFKYDLLYNPLRFESWQRLANIYDEEVDLLLNDGSKHINVAGWRKDATLPKRVETSRRRSRRCLIMSLALAKTPAQQCEMHELLALVYYDSIQNVAPFYDQRSVVPTKDATWMKFCENSFHHFQKAFEKKEDWSHAFYLGKLSEKLKYSREMALSYYDKAISLNPSAVDPVYRMHASQLKLLWRCDKKDLEALKVISAYSYSVKAAALDVLGRVKLEASQPPLPACTEEGSSNISEEGKSDKTSQLEEVWEMLYTDCLSALETCVQGDLKHFHKGRYMLAQSFYRRGKKGDLERAKDELSFCFKSSRSSFTINMWEIDGMVKKGRRRTPGLAGNKKALEVNLPESSRKFITCIRKYVLFYLKLLEEAKEIHTLDKALISFKADKRFSLCVEDLVPVALGRYIKALVSSMLQAQSVPSDDTNNSEHLLEKLFTLFMEQGNLWSDVCSVPELKGSGVSESILYGYLHQYIYNLEKNGKLETIEAINEKVRKRFKNPKLSNSNCAKVCRHVSVSWGRSLTIGLASITPLELGGATEVEDLTKPDAGSEMTRFLSVDLQTEELWKSSFEDVAQLKELETKWDSMLSGIKNIIIRKASSQNYDSAQALLRCAYSFYRESSCVMLPSGVNLYYSPNKLAAAEPQTKSGGEGGIEFLDVSTPRKLLLWAYTLVHGHCASISLVAKYCEENIKPKLKKGAGVMGTPLSTSTPSAASASTGKDGASNLASTETEPKGNELATGEKSGVASSSAGEDHDKSCSIQTAPPPGESRNSLSVDAKLQQCNNLSSEKRHAQSGGEGADPTEHK